MAQAVLTQPFCFPTEPCFISAVPFGSCHLRVCDAVWQERIQVATAVLLSMTVSWAVNDSVMGCRGRGALLCALCVSVLQLAALVLAQLAEAVQFCCRDNLLS